MLKKRVLTTLISLPVFIAANWFGGQWFTALIAVCGLMAAWEYCRLVEKAKAPVMTSFVLIFVLLFLAGSNLIANDFTANQSYLLITGVMLSLVWLLFRRDKETAFASWVWSLGGVIYLGLLFSHAIALRGLPNGLNWVFFAVIANAFSDSAAYFTGRRWGRHKLAPNISPKKTREGAAGGIAGAVIGGAGIFYLLQAVTPGEFPAGFGLAQALVLSVLISLTGQLGDLVESLFKRNMGAKESGNLLPGHGGFLDRLDSVVFVSVLVYYYVILFHPA
ncbi:MAG: phosphatidate cytidylyltransferase [Dehalococcoidia bacterium]|jgi:phosphatidate cytidylyltransferase|nr:MAG: phosphatidate cytidylyltransferase [Dehalococcoidia bacterium]